MDKITVRDNCFKDYYPMKYVTDSLGNYERNSFAECLMSRFNESDVLRMLNEYKIGTSKKNEGSAIFWRIDNKERVCSGDTYFFNHYTGKIIKRYDDIKKLSRGGFDWCYFGEHLLRSSQAKTIAILNCDALAVIASHVYPDYIWLSSGGRDRGNPKLLSRRTVIYDAHLDPEFSKLNEYLLVFDVRPR